MIIYWNRNIAEAMTAHAFMMKGNHLLNWYIASQVGDIVVPWHLFMSSSQTGGTP